MSEESSRSCLEPCLVFTTGNVHKTSKLEATLVPAWQGYAPGTIARTSDLNVPAPLEGGATFEENSLIKARAFVEFTGLLAFADDLGVCVDIMGGTPGVFSTRWCGVHGDDAANLDLLLAQLADVPGMHRGAVFVSVTALVFPDGCEFVERDEMRDTLVRERRGEGGSDYDSIFIPEGHSRTSAELSPEEENATSHRGKAFRVLLPAIIEALKDK